jgi:hypothetical protein
MAVRAGGAERVTRRVTGALRRAVGTPALQARLAEQDGAAAELRLALDTAVLALDQRMLDLYALTESTHRTLEQQVRELSERVELAIAETHRRADSIERALVSPESPLAELVSAEAARIDSYLVHHMTTLRSDLGIDRDSHSAISALDVVLRYGDWDVAVPPSERLLVDRLVGQSYDEIEPGVRAVLTRVLKPGGVAVAAGATTFLHALTLAEGVTADGRLIWFEPSSRLAASLRRTFALNGVGNRLELRQAMVAGAGGATLDDEIPAGVRVDVVRLVVEGDVAAVWRGCARVRRENPSVTFVLGWPEVRSNDLRDAFSDLFPDVEAAGFEAFSFAVDDPDGALSPWRNESSPSGHSNLLLRGG